MKSGGFQVKSDVSEISCRCFRKNSSDFTRFGVDFTWNLLDFMKSARFHLKSTGFHEICQISYRFHEIWWISWNPWNLADFTMKSGGFQVKLDVSEISCRCFSKNSSDFTRFGVDFTWNLLDFMKSTRFHLKSTRFHEICWISYGFHEIRWISWNPWNLADFTMKSGGFQVKLDVSEISCRCFSKNSSDFTRFGVDFTWNLLDFMKSTRFHLKSTRFHEICWISYGFHEIWWISWNPWNLADFTMKSGRFQVKSDVSEISCRCFSKNSSDFTRFGVDFTWNLPDFMKSAGFHLKSAGFHEIRRISYGFHEIRRISCEIERPLQGIVTLCLVIGVCTDTCVIYQTVLEKKIYEWLICDS